MDRRCFFTLPRGGAATALSAGEEPLLKIRPQTIGFILLFLIHFCSAMLSISVAYVVVRWLGG